MEGLWGVKMSLGTLSSLEEATSRALESVVDGVAESVRGASVVNMDETGWQRIMLAPGCRLQ